MRKYQQLLLVIVAIFSFCCLLIYRHEYNKLHYVLEVFNFFGSPGLPPVISNTCKPIEVKFYGSPVPMWQRITNSLHIYSAYWKKLNGREFIEAVAIGQLNENFNYGCYLWYNKNYKTLGSFNYSVLDVKNQYLSAKKKDYEDKVKPLKLYCHSHNSGDPPNGVIFFDVKFNQSSHGFLPVTLVKSSLPPENSVVVCIMPHQILQFNKSTYLEFLTFHKAIGLDNYFIYGSNNQYNLLPVNEFDLGHQILTRNLPWNYPYYNSDEIMKILAETDCLTRSTGIFENVIILDWNKFLVPDSFSNLPQLLNILDSEKKVSTFLFPVRIFCLENKDISDENSSMPLIFRKKKYSIPKINVFVPIYRHFLKIKKIQKFEGSLVKINQYSYCEDIKSKLIDKKNNIDISISKFRNEYFKNYLKPTINFNDGI